MAEGSDKEPAAPLRVLIANSSRKWISEAAHCFQLYEKLAEHGHTVRLAVREGWELEARARAAEMNVAPFRFRSRFSPLSDWRDMRRMARLVRHYRIDVVHCHRGKDHWIAALAMAFLRAGVPLVRTRHVVTPVGAGPFNRWLFGHATARIIAVSSAAQAGFGAVNRRWLERSLMPRMRIVHPAVDLARFSPDRRSDEWRRKVGAEDGDILIGLIGRFQRVKGQWEFLRASGILARDFPRVWFLLAGRGTDEKRQRYRHMAEALGIEDRFTLLGELDDVAPLIASLDIGVVASLGSEASSRVVLEYMASARPIVASRVGGIPDLVEDGKTGRLVPPGDVAALRDAISDLVKSPELRRRLGEAARARAEEYFHFDRWIAQTVGVYREALGQKAPETARSENDGAK